MGSNGIEWDRMGSDRIEWDRMGSDRMGSNGILMARLRPRYVEDTFCSRRNASALRAEYATLARPGQLTTR
ncbi:Protein of unknown function [Gryllus bimaculatus]|nr:Protein of unknown function [Gryllus bimaculatus]